MRIALHTFILTSAMVLVTHSQAQNHVAIEGHIAPCVGMTYAVHIQTWPGTLPTLDTTVQTGSNCDYFLMYGSTSSSGVLNVSISCDSGITFISDTASFDINFLGGDTVHVDLACGGGTYDCNGLFNGPAMPGSACDDGDPLTLNDIWSADCLCVGDGNVYDCTGLVNGPNMPGAFCWGMTPDSTWFGGAWTAQCVCAPDSNFFDCLGVLNGPNLPGTSCDDGNSLSFNDTWNTNCACAGNFNAPCQALFTIVQALGLDSMFIPNDLWLYNLSNGGNGALSYFWDFGDGATSTESQPIHAYVGNGPYWLCVTVDDGMGCTDSYCDSVSVDDNGIYSGVMGGNGSRTSGFVVNVVDQLSLGITDQLPTMDLTTWPNPVNEELNVSFTSSITGVMEIAVLDMNGAIVTSQNATLSKGKVLLHIPTADLSEGIYVLRMSNAHGMMGRRFVK